MNTDPLSVALRDARVPRYTSYPPANRFSPAVGATELACWIAGIPSGASVSLYVHIPFCRRLCWFCACRTQGTKSNVPLDRYLHHLEQEIALVSDLLPGKTGVANLHLGGGTPTILSQDRMDRLAGWLGAAFDFDADAGISVEIDPCDCGEARLDALMRLGMNRVSIGVQDFDPRVQAAIGRQQSIAMTQEVVRNVRARGIGSVNFDLVYGLPHQTEATLCRTLDTVIALQPDRLALYGYAHVPWMARRQKVIADSALPHPADRLHLATRARERLVVAGYVPVGIDHFALPGDGLARAATQGRLHRSFQGYTTDEAQWLIGLGPSAISTFPEGIAQNVAATGAWQARIASGCLATARGHRLSAADRLAADVIERLMCDLSVDLARIARRHAVPAEALLARARKAITAMPGTGSLHGCVLKACAPGTVRLLCAGFDPGFEKGTRTYSLAT